MLSEFKSYIEDIDQGFQIQPIKIIFVKPVQKMNLAGKVIGPFEEGVEKELPQWISDVLVESGYAKYNEGEFLSLSDITKVHWRESLPKSRSLSVINPDFYSRLRKLLKLLQTKGNKDIEKLKEYEKIYTISKDILNCRLKKIVLFAASPYQSEDIKKNLTPEELGLLEELNRLISEWKNNMLEAK